MKHILGSGYASMGGNGGDWEDIYMAAEENVEYDDDIIIWLEENMKNCYSILDEYEHEGWSVTCTLILHIPLEEHAMAFILRWL